MADGLAKSNVWGRGAPAAGCALIAAAGLWAQEPPAAGQRGKGGRGWRPGGGFLVSEIETINPVNGNVLLRIPLASLPPGRGGSAFTLDLLYNSQIWDVDSQLVDAGQYPDTGTVYELRHTLRNSAQGGWRYGFQYGLEFEERMGVPSPDGDCRSVFDKYTTKMRVHFPDGSAHLLRLVNAEDTVGDDNGDGFYAWQSVVKVPWAARQAPAASFRPGLTRISHQAWLGGQEAVYGTNLRGS